MDNEFKIDKYNDIWYYNGNSDNICINILYDNVYNKKNNKN